MLTVEFFCFCRFWRRSVVREGDGGVVVEVCAAKAQKQPQAAYTIQHPTADGLGAEIYAEALFVHTGASRV